MSYEREKERRVLTKGEKRNTSQTRIFGNTMRPLPGGAPIAQVKAKKNILYKHIYHVRAQAGHSEPRVHEAWYME